MAVFLRVYDIESFGGVDSANTVSAGDEGKNAVSQADVVRVQESEKKAKEVAGQKAQHRKNNIALAKFFGECFTKLPDHVITPLYEVFFTKRNPTTGAKEFENTNAMILLAGLLVPFFPTEAETLGLYATYQKISDTNIGKSRQKYIYYAQSVIMFVQYSSNNSQWAKMIYVLGRHADLELSPDFLDHIDILTIASLLDTKSLS